MRVGGGGDGYGQVFWQFLPLGVIAYGGPNAHIALLHERFVDKSKWLTEEQFVELMAVGQGLPGPTSTQVSPAAMMGVDMHADSRYGVFEVVRSCDNHESLWVSHLHFDTQQEYDWPSMHHWRETESD